MKKSKYAFTMIEMVFVIVVLGILAAIAIPKFAATRTDAEIAKARTDIASIRSAIVTERQTRLIRGDSTWIPSLSSTGANLFMGHDVNRTLLMYGIATGGGWTNTGTTAGTSDTYTFTLSGTRTTFYYNATNATATIGGVSVPAGGFTCAAGANDCNVLVN